MFRYFCKDTLCFSVILVVQKSRAKLKKIIKRDEKRGFERGKKILTSTVKNYDLENAFCCNKIHVSFILPRIKSDPEFELWNRKLYVPSVIKVNNEIWFPKMRLLKMN